MVIKNISSQELNEIGISEDRDFTLFINKSNQPCKEIDWVAKIVEFSNEANGDVSQSYYIKYYRGDLFDPHGMDSLKLNAKDMRFKKVDKFIFDKYRKYLETRRETFLLEAKRDFISKGY